MAYSKLHSSLVNSSLWTEEDHVRILFITLLALCDADGCVYGSRMGLERVAMIDQDACKERDPWAVLLGPDYDSSDKMRAPENEGRRIEEIPGGFRLLNFAYYRGLRNDDDRREQNRLAQERFRNKSKPQSATVSRGKPVKAQAEAEAEAEAAYAPAERPNRKEFVEFAVSPHCGLAEWKAADTWNEMQACGWLDYNRRSVRDWKAFLLRVKTKWEADGRPNGPPGAKSSLKGPPAAKQFGVRATASFRP